MSNDPWELHDPAPPVDNAPPGPPITDADALYCYTSEFYVARWESKNGHDRKRFAPFCWDGRQWVMKQLLPAGSRPLFQPNNTGSVASLYLIVEGEKAAIAASGLIDPKIRVLTWSGGSSAVAQTDWTPLKNSAIVIWPDNDDPGRAAAKNIQAKLPHAKIIDVPFAFPEGWDLADPLPGGYTIEKIQEIITGIKAEKPKEKENKHRFKLTPFDSISLNTDRNYLIKGMIPREGLVVIWGAPKCGKTFWTFDLVMHITAGWEYRGRKVQQGCVVYVACEGERGLHARVAAFRESKMDGIKGVPFHLITTRLDLVEDCELLMADIAAQLPPETAIMATVIDTLNRSMVGSESKDEDMGAYIKAADTMREGFKCAVIIIHHCGLNDARPRGHTSLAGAVDTQISVKKDVGGTITAEVELMKDGEEGAQVKSLLRVVELEDDADGDPITSCVIEALDNDDETPKQRKKPITGAAKLALDQLYNEINTSGEIPHTDYGTPPGVTCVTMAKWKLRLEKTEIINADGSPREQLRRIRVTLGSAGYIGVSNPFVWIVT